MHAATTKNNHSKLGSRNPTHCFYKCAFANVVLIESLHRHNRSRHTFGHYKYSIKKYAYIYIGQLVVYVTDVSIVEIVKEGQEGSHARTAYSFLALLFSLLSS